MNLLDRYIQAIRNNLPTGKQADLTAEIRSLIEDTLDDRSQAEGRPVDEEMVAETLKEFGPPEKVAASYLPERYLVGPQLYPTYILVLRIVLTVIMVVALVGLGVDIAQRGQTLADFIDSFSTGLAGLISSLFQVLGTITLVFAIIERVQPNFKEKSKEWDPHQLKEIQAGDNVRPAGQIVELVITSMAVILFNFYPQVVGLYSMVDGQWSGVPLLSPEFFRYLPWLNVVWGASMLLNLLLINSGRWTKLTRWITIIINTLAIVITTSMLLGANLVALDSAAYGRLGWEESSAQALSGVFNGATRFILAVILISHIADLGKALWQIFGKGKQVPFISSEEKR